ncbi:SemiSWEET family sugar transporter [Lacibacterium aquatile]|uniref:SemiSWEET family sugar transporter n=1 Tax=Lacibacterium aquatile TaxID=1168082 RepID=A0ABW5DW93_9PROT
MEPVTLIGAAATLCSTVSFAPQAWKIIKSRDTAAISMLTYSFTVAGFAFWLAYGILLLEWPLIVTNGVCLVLSAFILTMKILPRDGKNAVADAIDPAPGNG